VEIKGEVEYIPIAGPGVGNLVVGLLLRTAEVEEETAFGDVALVAVGHGKASAVAVGSILDGVDGVADGEEGLHVEVDATSAGAGGQDVIGDCV
jgi:hypothetical protein